MKHLIIFIVLILFVINSYGQWLVNFDDSSSMNYIYIDTINYPNNNWQIGSPQKALFDSSYSSPYAIIIDTNSTYPTNDTSVFYLWHTVHLRPVWWPILSFQYKMDSDSLNDIGKIEVSPDYGQTWIDIIKDAYTFGWHCSITTDQGNWFPCDSLSLTGTLQGWYKLGIIMFNWDQYFGYNDSLLFRFTFISDSIETNQEGWIIDDIFMDDIIENIEELSSKKTINVFPNPTDKFISIDIKTSNFKMSDILITDNKGRIVIQKKGLQRKTIKINVAHLTPGIYYWTLIDRKNNIKEHGKIIKE
ncbi:T9SS type A sorting domain-containing protein [candidate division KSB1 bacterium]